MTFKKWQIIVLYILNFTWGIIMTTIGLIGALVLMITGNKPQLFYHNIYFQLGAGWGGVSLGCIFMLSNSASTHTKQHESGHIIQNALFGPLFPFLIGIPSILRAQMRSYASIVYKDMFVSVTLGSVGLLFIIGLILAIIYQAIIWVIVFSALLLYIIGLCIWLFGFELPRYKNDLVAYDAFWAEGQATKLGEKYFPYNMKKE